MFSSFLFCLTQFSFSVIYFDPLTHKLEGKKVYILNFNFWIAFFVNLLPPRVPKSRIEFDMFNLFYLLYSLWLVGEGDNPSDMRQQVQSNNIRIQILEEQNNQLRKNITKMLDGQGHKHQGAKVHLKGQTADIILYPPKYPLTLYLIFFFFHIESQTANLRVSCLFFP